MQNTITVYYPISMESKEVYNEAMKYGNVMQSPANMDTREIHTTMNRLDLSELENFFKEREIAYDLMEYSNGIRLPKMKKVRPEMEYEKEIACDFCQNADEELEEGYISVSNILDIINQLDNETIKVKLMEEIKPFTFNHDNVENIFEM